MRAAIRSANARPRLTPEIEPLEHQPTPHRGWPPALLAAVAGGLLLLGMVVGVNLSQARCEGYTEQRREISTLINQGKSAIASGMAELYLANNNLCPDAKLEIANLAYQASLRDILSIPQLQARDLGVGQAAALRWQEAERKADSYNLPTSRRTPPMSISVEAYNAGLWALSRAAFVKALESGAVSPHDLKAIAHYYALLRNWGNGLLEQREQEAHQQGLVLLRTAREVSQAYRLPQAEAQQDLVRLLGADSLAWPSPDVTDPVLAWAKR
jgi:hypothetical protein